MNRLLGPLAVPDTGDSDVDALQTDVMRFLSIIALCLLAVFAAVSTEPPAGVLEMVQVQDATISALQREVTDKTQSLEDTIEQLEQEKEKLKQALDNSELETSNITEQHIEQLQSQNASLQQQMQQMSEALKHAEQRNAGLESVLEKLNIEQLTSDPVEEQIQVEAEAVETVVEPEPETTTDTAPTEEKEGFTLAFESNSVLKRLVQQGRVNLYARSNQQVWQVNANGSILTLVKGVSEFFQLSSVPADYHRLAQRKLQSLDVEWGVSFESSIRTQLQNLLTQHRGGDILVKETGELLLNQP